MTDASVAWHRISPEAAVHFSLPHKGIVGPLTMDGVVCPWPWEPQQLGGQPLGQYHCSYCGEMCISGMLHVDYTEDFPVPDNDTPLKIRADAAGRYMRGVVGMYVEFRFRGVQVADIVSSWGEDGAGPFITVDGVRYYLGDDLRWGSESSVDSEGSPPSP